MFLYKVFHSLDLDLDLHRKVFHLKELYTKSSK
jgi:hypothetical protein